MQEYVIECFNTETHEFEYLRISAIVQKKQSNTSKFNLESNKIELEERNIFIGILNKFQKVRLDHGRINHKTENPDV